MVPCEINEILVMLLIPSIASFFSISEECVVWEGYCTRTLDDSDGSGTGPSALE